MQRIVLEKGKIIGEAMPIFIVAEAGVNHNGSLKLARKLVDAAIHAGCGAIKFQTFNASSMISKFAPMANYQQANIGRKYAQLELIKKLELSGKDFILLKKYCDKKGIMFFSTPFDEESVDFLDNLGVCCFKVGSGDLDNLPLLELIVKKGRPVIVSTGMSTIGEISEAVEIFRKNRNNKICLLQCTSNYPAMPEDINLKAMATLRKKFGLLVGFSDHSTGIEISLAAVALGAVIIEKHLTLNRNMKGPDHKASLNPTEFKSLVEGIRKIESALGNGVKRIMKSELNTCKVARKSIVANRDIATGQIIEKEHLAVKRPDNGLSPKFINNIVGRKARCNIKADEPITWEKV